MTGSAPPATNLSKSRRRERLLPEERSDASVPFKRLLTAHKTSPLPEAPDIRRAQVAAVGVLATNCSPR